jgi:hypothetical protein
MPRVFESPRHYLVDGIRGQLQPGGDDVWVTGDQDQTRSDMDPDDPVPVIRLLNRQALGEELDPAEALAALEPSDSMVIGDVATCLAKMKKYADAGVDRLLTFQSYGWLTHEDVTGSMRRIGEQIVPVLSA